MWMEEARLDAILCSCRRSLPSLRSGIRCYMSFVAHCAIAGKERKPQYFPPSLETLLAWSSLFRCPGTWSNYIGYVKTACMLCKASTAVLDDPAMRRAKSSIAKRRNFIPRTPLWIRRQLVEEVFTSTVGVEGLEAYAHLYLMTYCFLLRLPSEALPVCAGPCDGPATLHREGDKIVLTLARRKNRPQGSRLVRGCWCKQSKATCPLHVLGPFLDKHASGQPLFKGITAACALGVLRDILKTLQVPDFEKYRTHDLRRGHAKDLQLSGTSGSCLSVGCVWLSVVKGAPLWVILAAGEWTSPAFLRYLDIHRLETDLVIQAHIENSDEEPDS